MASAAPDAGDDDSGPRPPVPIEARALMRNYDGSSCFLHSVLVALFLPPDVRLPSVVEGALDDALVGAWNVVNGARVAAPGELAALRPAIAASHPRLAEYATGTRDAAGFCDVLLDVWGMRLVEVRTAKAVLFADGRIVNNATGAPTVTQHPDGRVERRAPAPDDALPPRRHQNWPLPAGATSLADALADAVDVVEPSPGESSIVRMSTKTRARPLSGALVLSRADSGGGARALHLGVVDPRAPRTWTVTAPALARAQGGAEKGHAREGGDAWALQSVVCWAGGHDYALALHGGRWWLYDNVAPAVLRAATPAAVQSHASRRGVLFVLSRLPATRVGTGPALGTGAGPGRGRR